MINFACESRGEFRACMIENWTVVGRGYFSYDSSHSENEASAFGVKINRKPVNQQLAVSNIWLLKMSLSSQTRLVKISVLENYLTRVSFLHKIVFFLKELTVLKDMLTA